MLNHLAADPNNSVDEIRQTLGISRMTYYRYMNAEKE